jgi:hypothetical protein
MILPQLGYGRVSKRLKFGCKFTPFQSTKPSIVSITIMARFTMSSIILTDCTRLSIRDKRLVSV